MAATLLVSSLLVAHHFRLPHESTEQSLRRQIKVGRTNYILELAMVEPTTTTNGMTARHVPPWIGPNPIHRSRVRDGPHDL